MKRARSTTDAITLSDLHEDTRAMLMEQGITTYTELFAHIDDPAAPSELRGSLLWFLYCVSSQIDRRRVIGVLLRALRSPDDDIRLAALRASGTLHLKRTIPLVMSLARDKAESSDIRNGAVRALGGLRYPGGSHTELIEQAACDLIFDETDAVAVRAEALELFSPAVVKRYGLAALTGLLSHPSADLRFWAAFGFPSIGGCDDDGCRLDITAAIPVLDHLVAFDHTVPEYWGWHVGREALEALENFYAHQYGLSRAGVWLISPAKEYWTFSQEMRTFVQWGKPFEMKDGYDARPALNVDPVWLADHLRAAFPGVNFEARPGSQAYLLSWLVETEGETVLGGLHRDGYALVLTGDDEAILRVARWYRRIISSETPLYLYEWAGPAELLEGL
ncbi:MAG: HEAT repeat domain-containing protein [Anaerolineae bacterium]|nr:HEAT repeat domain-containing protein [Anaerolineae bacterium]